MSERIIYLNHSDGFTISINDETDELVISLERKYFAKISHTVSMDEIAVLEGCLLAIREKHKFKV